MKATRSRAFRVALAIGFGTALIGIGLIVWSRLLPVFVVPFEDAMRAYDAICPISGERYDHTAAAQYSALFGWRYSMANAGMSLLLGSLTAVGGLLLLARGTSQPLRTPGYRWQFLALGILAIFLFWLGSVKGLETDLKRQYFPVCADSIGIPIYMLTLGLGFLTPVLALGGFLLTRGFGTLPVRLTQWDSARPRRSWTVSAIFLALALLNVGALAIGILSSDLILPAGVLTTYLLLATRAALLAGSTPDSAT